MSVCESNNHNTLSNLYYSLFICYIGVHQRKSVIFVESVGDFKS
jgi:hypothetical protein